MKKWFTINRQLGFILIFFVLVTEISVYPYNGLYKHVSRIIYYVEATIFTSIIFVIIQLFKKTRHERLNKTS